MNELTKKLLLACKKEGYRFVAIGQAWNRIKASKDFPWPSISIFCSPDVRRDGWPAIWDIARELGVYAGAGNYQQAQYKGALTHGKYDLSKL